MLYIVWNAEGKVLYEGRSWPMARAALDHVLLMDDGCPKMEVIPEPKPEM